MPESGRRIIVSAPNPVLSPEMVRDYIATHGALCPFCKSPEIESGWLDAEGECAWAQVGCLVCHRKWQDVSYLRALDVIAEDGSITTIKPGSQG
jgi:hypothetical protein